MYQQEDITQVLLTVPLNFAVSPWRNIVISLFSYLLKSMSIYVTMWTDLPHLPCSHPVQSFYWFHRFWGNLEGLGGWRVYKKVKLAATVVIKTLCSFYARCMWQRFGLSVATVPILSLTSFLWTTFSWSLLGVLIGNYDFIFSNESTTVHMMCIQNA